MSSIAADFLTDPTAFSPMKTTAGKDLPVGYELEPVTKKISLDKARIYEGWPATRSRHCDYDAAHATGLPAPNINGAQVAHVLGELFIKFFGEDFVGGAALPRRRPREPPPWIRTCGRPSPGFAACPHRP